MKKLQRGLPRGRYSKHGYKRNSPDVNKPFNIIPSGNITMKDVDFPVKGIDNLGNEQIMYPGVNYIFPGDYVLELPMMQPGGSTSNIKRVGKKKDEKNYIDSVLNANKNLDWVQRLYGKNPQSIQIPGERGRSTHFMESADNKVYPSVVRLPNGNLEYLGDNAYNYANSTKSFIQFPSDEEAQWFAKNYKKGTAVLPKKQNAGEYYTPASDNTRVNYTPVMTVQTAKKLKAERDAQELARRKQAIQASQTAASRPLKQRITPENLAQETGATGDKLRFFPNDPNSFIDDYLNPFKMIGDMASGLGRIPLNISQGNYGQAVMSVATPVVVGATAGLGAKSAGQFVNNLANPLAGTGQFLTTKTPLRNAYKYNPWAFKPNEANWYRQVGKSAIDDALETGIIREAGEEVSPRMYQEFQDQLVRMQGNGMNAALSSRRPASPFFGKGELFYPMGRKPIINKTTGKLSKNPAGAGSADYLIETSLPNESFQPAYVKGMGLGVPTEVGSTAILKPDPSLRNLENFNIYKQDWLQGYKPINTPAQLPGFRSEIDWGKWNPDTPKYPELINEYNAIEESTKKAGTWMKNPDGSPFQGTPEQFIQQQSSWFKKAFGDSKLVNPDGSPMFLYHGSAKKFDTFDPSKFQLGDAGSSGAGIYTTPNKRIADSYSLSSSSLHHGDKTPTVYQLYGKANNPISSEEIIKNTGTGYPNRFESNQAVDLFNFHRNTAPKHEQLLNYDVAIHNQQRGIENIRKWNDAWEIVFPTNKQLKSAVGNVGFFDMTNPNIYKTVVPAALGAGAMQETPEYQIGGYIPSWLNPYNWGVEDYSDKGDFNTAYFSAKKAGEEEFMWNGKRYNTKYAGTPRQEVGTYGVDGKPVNVKDLSEPSQVNLYPAFGKYLPGHVSAMISTDPESASVDYSSKGNMPWGIGVAKNKGESSYFVYGNDKEKFYNKAVSLPTGDYFLEDEYTPSDWNLLTNNCADNVCDAFGIPRSKGVQTPSGAMSKIKKKYPTLDVTGRTYEDYVDIYEKLQTQSNKKILSQAKNILGIASSPDLQQTNISKKLISTIQGVLADEGYSLPNSTKQDGSFDGVLGDETINALMDYQTKNKTLPKKQLAGQTSSTPFRFYDYQTPSTYFGGTLPEVMVSSDNVPYSYYNQLTPEEKRFFNQNSPIGRGVRSIANTGKRGQTYNDLSRVAKDAESFAAEMTGIPGSIRFAQDPVKKLKGAGRTLEATILGSSPFVNAPYNQEDVADTFDAMDAFGWAATPFSFAKEPLKQSVKLPLQVIKRPSKQTARSLKNTANTLTENIPTNPDQLVNTGFKTDPWYHYQRFLNKKSEIANAIKTNEGGKRIQGYIDKNPHLQNKTVDDIISDFEKTTFEIKAPKYNSQTNEWTNSFVNPNNAYNWYRKGNDNPSYMSIGKNFTPYDADHILEHEFAHVFQRNNDIIGVDDVLSSITLKSDKDFLAPNKKTFKDYFNKYNPFIKKEKDIGYSVSGDIFGTGENQVNRIPNLERQKNYWLFGAGKGQEKAAFAAEVRENLLQKGILKNRYNEITPKMLKKHYKSYHNTTGNKYNLRLYDIMTNDKNNFNFLSKGLNNMPTTLPYVGAGSLGYQGLQEQQVPQQKFGGTLPKAQAGAFGTITTPVPFTLQKENTVIPKRFALPRIQPKVNPVVPEMITIKDGRKIRLTTGQAVNPNTDLVGKSYPTKTLRSILDTAKNRGLSKDDALTLAAMDLQETRWGETDDAIGHVLHGNDFAKSPVENFVNAYLKSKETADRLKLSDEYTRLQVYNGLGTVTPDTEKDYHGFRMKKIYGVPVPASGINMRENPLYGKQIVDIRDNVLKQNPEFLKLVDEYYKMGGVTNEMLDVYKNYINGVYTNTEKEKDAIKIYDKLNRKYYREAKNVNKSVPNYIMSLIK